MKTILNILAFAVLACFTTDESHSQGFLVPNGVTDHSSGGAPIFHVIQNATSSDYTGFFLFPQGGNSFKFSSFLDEGVRVFFVEGGDSISAPVILANSYSELTYPNTYVFQNGVSLYVGLYTGYGYTGTYTDPVFGWAELVNNNGTIQLLDSALATNSLGIYAGATTLIPEPSALSLFGLGALLLGWRWHCKRSQWSRKLGTARAEVTCRSQRRAVLFPGGRKFPAGLATAPLPR